MVYWCLQGEKIFTRSLVGQWLMYRHVDVRSLAIKNLKVSECILKSTRCPAGSQYRPIKTDPFPKQGTELKKTRPFSTVEHFRQCLYKHMNRQSCFNLVCRGPFVSCVKYRDVLGADQTKSGIWVREIDHIHYRKRKLVTLRLRCESVSNSLNISRTKKKCRDNVVKTL